METANGGNITIARPEGKVDGTNSRAFQAELDEITSETSGAVVLDMERIDYVSSAGLRVILLAAKALERESRRFSMSSLNSEVQDVMKISGFDQIITVYGDSEEAAQNEAAQAG